ncbi:MAG: copper chaperone PCu(A)C [Candidimonas sp.]|nr:MAG: copper chaperone PCu(A)C [Candidimonas sp.]
MVMETMVAKRALRGLVAVGGLAVASAAAAMSMAGGNESMAPRHAAQSASISVSGCWIRSLPPPAPSAAYFVVHNEGIRNAALTGASSPAFGSVMLHKSIESGGVSSMVMEPRIPVPAKGNVTFKPGSYHAMLEKPRQKLVVGTKLELDLQLASGETARASCLVRPAGALSR